MDVVDIVIDTGAPIGDAVMDIEGLDHRVGAESTVLGAALIQALVAETAERLVGMGERPVQIPSHNRRDGSERSAGDAMRDSVHRWAERTGRRLMEAAESVPRGDVP